MQQVPEAVLIVIIYKNAHLTNCVWMNSIAQPRVFSFVGLCLEKHARMNALKIIINQWQSCSSE